MNKLMWSSFVWITYRCWSKIDWSVVQNFLCVPEINREFLMCTAKSTSKIACYFFLIWQVCCFLHARLQYKLLLGRLMNFMEYYKVPKYIQKSVLECYAQAWSMDIIKFPVTKLGTNILPNQLFQNMLKYIGMTIVEKLKLYGECFRFFAFIKPKVKIQKFSSGELVYKKGAVADKMYFVAKGILEATSDTGELLETISTGDVVGEIGVLHIDGHYLRTANVRSISNSKLLALKEKDVNEIIKDFPEAKRMLESVGRRRLLRANSTE